jgi:multidrug efflux system membrane fusion protein
MNARSFFLLVCGGSGLLLGTVGSGHGSLQADTGAPPVLVSRPVAREVTDYVDFTGRTEAARSVNVVARVSGYLVNTPFQEGSDVKAGDLLFEIDPRPYQAQCDLAKSQMDLHQAQLKLAQATLVRDQQALRTTPGAPQLEQDHAAVNQAEAQIKVAQAGLEVSQLNLAFCKVISPIDGQVGRYYLTPGNLVVQDQTVLTTVVSHDPIYACVDVDEATMQRVRRAINESQIKTLAAGQVPVLMGLQNEDGFPRGPGRVNLIHHPASRMGSGNADR